VTNKIMELFDKISSKMGKTFVVRAGSDTEDYIELEEEMAKKTARILIKFFTLKDYAEVKPVLDTIREGYSIALIKIKPLREKDISDLKRTINKIKRTCAAAQAEVVGIDENYIVTVPNFVDVVRGETGTTSEKLL